MFIIVARPMKDFCFQDTWFCLMEDKVVINEVWLNSHDCSNEIRFLVKRYSRRTRRSLLGNCCKYHLVLVVVGRFEKLSSSICTRSSEKVNYVSDD